MKKWCSCKSWPNEDKNIFCPFFKYLLNNRVEADKFELNEVSISNFVKFRFQSKSSKIEQSFEKKKKSERTLIRMYCYLL